MVRLLVTSMVELYHLRVDDLKQHEPHAQHEDDEAIPPRANDRRSRRGWWAPGRRYRRGGL